LLRVFQRVWVVGAEYRQLVGPQFLEGDGVPVVSNVKTTVRIILGGAWTAPFDVGGRVRVGVGGSTG
jgi:hypothetical protein